jgi:hypothetical protein
MSIQYMDKITIDEYGGFLYLHGRKYYIEFATSTTKGNVYNAISNYITYVSGDITLIGASGRYGPASILEIENNGSGNIYFKGNDGNISLTCTSDSSTQLEHPLQIDFVVPATPTNI